MSKMGTNQFPYQDDILRRLANGAATAAAVSNTIAGEGRAPGHGENWRGSTARSPRTSTTSSTSGSPSTPTTPAHGSAHPGRAGRRRVTALRVVSPSPVWTDGMVIRLVVDF